MLQKNGHLKAKNIHLHASQEFYTELSGCTELARQNPNIACVTFDFQRTHLYPIYIPTGDIFYLRQLWVHVFGIHDCSCSDASMYVWLENVSH